MTVRERIALFGAYALANALFLAFYSWEAAIVVLVLCVLIGMIAA